MSLNNPERPGLLEALTVAADWHNNNRGRTPITKQAPAAPFATRVWKDTIVKRIPEESPINVDDLERMMKHADALIAAGNYEAAERLLDKIVTSDAADELIRKVKRKKPVEDDGEVEDDWSEAADSRKSKKNAKASNTMTKMTKMTTKKMTTTFASSGHERPSLATLARPATLGFTTPSQIWPTQWENIASVSSPR